MDYQEGVQRERGSDRRSGKLSWFRRRVRARVGLRSSIVLGSYGCIVPQVNQGRKNLSIISPYILSSSLNLSNSKFQQPYQTDIFTTVVILLWI